MKGLSDLAERIRRHLANARASVHPSPIILMGNQKSGTSVIAHLVADWGGLSKTVDIPPIWRGEGAKIIRSERTFSDFVRQNRSYFSTAVIKEPMLTFFAGQVLQRFPDAKYVFVVRDPRANIRSLLNRRKLPGHLDRLGERDLEMLGEDRILVDSSVWGGEGENYIGTLATRWNRAVDEYFEFQSRMILASYEEFVADKLGFIEALALQLGIAHAEDITEKLDIQYQPRGDRDVGWHEFFGDRNLRFIEDICMSRMERLGYSTCL